MPEFNNRIDLTPVVAAIARVMIVPYQDLLDRLHADGRVTETELEELNQLIKARGERLADFVQAELAKANRP